jgi:hypothetical protein
MYPDYRSDRMKAGITWEQWEDEVDAKDLDLVAPVEEFDPDEEQHSMGGCINGLRREAIDAVEVLGLWPGA